MTAKADVAAPPAGVTRCSASFGAAQLSSTCHQSSNQIHHPVIELKFYNDLGIGGQEGWKCRCHMAQAERHRRGQAHPAVWNCRRSMDFGLYRLALGENAGCADRQDASGLGQRKAVRWISRSPSRASSRCIAFDTVGPERPRSAAAAAKEPVSATLAKIAQASRSGRDIALPQIWQR